MCVLMLIYFEDLEYGVLKILPNYNTLLGMMKALF